MTSSRRVSPRVVLAHPDEDSLSSYAATPLRRDISP
jgi:hypothetical protein